VLSRYSVQGQATLVEPWVGAVALGQVVAFGLEVLKVRLVVVGLVDFDLVA
jgi:hypothetical protein